MMDFPTIVTTLGTVLAILAGVYTLQKAQSAGVNAKIDGIADGQVRLETRMDRFEVRMDRFEVRMDRFEESLNATEQRLEAKIDALDAKFDAKFDAQDRKFDRKFDLVNGQIFALATALRPHLTEVNEGSAALVH